MKRKGKIITTIASLCLAVALMAFGVYAASQATVNVTSKVSYVVTDVFVTVKGVVETKGDTYAQATVTGEGASATYGGGLAGEGVKSYTDLNNPTAAGQNTTALTAWDAGEFAFDSTHRYYKMTITIANDSADSAIKVKLDKVMDEITGTTRTAKYSVTDGATDQELGTTSIAVPAGKTLTLELERYLVDTHTKIDATNNFGAQGLTITMINQNVAGYAEF